jgi:hypothetical protein
MAKAPQTVDQTPAPELTLEEMEAQMLESKAAFESEVAAKIISEEDGAVNE